MCVKLTLAGSQDVNVSVVSPCFQQLDMSGYHADTPITIKAEAIP